MTGQQTAARALGVVTGLTGAALAVMPREVGARVCGPSALPQPSIMRFLGGRYVAQGLAESVWPTPSMLKSACAVDCLHAASMVAAAGMSREYRKAASASLLFAVTSAACTGALARFGV